MTRAARGGLGRAVAGRLGWLAAGSCAAWLLLRSTTPLWAPGLGQAALAGAQAVEPWPLTRAVRVIEGGRALEVRHVHERRVPRVPRVPVLPLVYGHALWAGLALAAPGPSWRRRSRDLLVGWLALSLVSWIALVVRIEYAFAQIPEPPFPQLIAASRRAVLYFAHGYLLDVGLFVGPLALAGAMHHVGWAALVLPSRALEPVPARGLRRSTKARAA